MIRLIFVAVLVIVSAAEASERKTLFDWYESVAKFAAERIGLEKYFAGTEARLNSAFLSSSSGGDGLDVDLADLDHSKNINESIAILREDERKSSTEIGRNHSRIAVGILERLLSVRDKCDLEGFSILRDADLLTGRHAHDEPLTPFDNAVRGYMTKHAQICGPKYLSKMQSSCSELSQADLRAINTVTKPVIVISSGERDFQNHLGANSTKLIKLIGSLNHLHAWKGAREIFEAVDSLIPSGDLMKQDIRGKDNGSGGKTIDRAQAEEALDKLIGSPCENFVSKLAHVAIPALYDMESLGKPFELENGNDEVAQNFNGNILKFKVCASIIGPLNDVLPSVIKYGLNQ